MVTLSDVSCATITVSNLCRMLDTYGVVRVPGFLAPNETEAALREAKRAVSRFANYRNPYGECSRFSLETIPKTLSRSRDLTTGRHLEQLPPKFSFSRSVLDRHLFRQLVQKYLGSSAGFMEVVVFTRDHIPDPNAVYGWLHYDRRHQLKLIFYLNDCDEKNGAFGCIPGSHRVGRKLFREGWSRALSLEPMHGPAIDAAAAEVPEDHEQYLSVPCVVEDVASIDHLLPFRERVSMSGSAGTLVAFDSHVLHYGGMVHEPTERWTLKGHTFAEVNRSKKG